MCGIAGIISNNKNFRSKSKDLLAGIRHRGPDSEGVFIHDSVCLIHSRLSILDISESGNQPMTSFNERYVIVFNGEIYNYIELSKYIDKDFDLDKISDTRIILEFIQRKGVKSFLDLADGMWSFALYDRKKFELFLSRDISGQKPLFYYKNENEICFSSNCSSLITHIGYELNNEELKTFIESKKLDLKLTNNIDQVKPGSFLRISTKEINILDEELYFNIPKSRSLFSTQKRANKILLESMKITLRSHANLGFFLSGGIDSTISLLYATKIIEPSKITAFSVKFQEIDFDESHNASIVASKLGVNHEILTLKPINVIDFFEKTDFRNLDYIGDSSLFPIFYLSKYASNKVKVIITGDGGDEIFGGYNRHIFYYSNSLLSIIKRNILKILSTKALDLISKIMLKIGKKQLALKVIKSKRIKRSQNIYEFYKSLISYGNSSSTNKSDIIGFNKYDDLMKLDFLNYLPTVLSKVDNATMYHGIESRTFFLNKKVVNYGLSIQINNLINANLGKIPLRKILNENFSQTNIFNKKQGFTPPIYIWFKNDLKNWIIKRWNNLDKNLLRLLKELDLNNILNDFFDEKSDDYELIWNILFLDAKIKQQ